MNVNKKVQNEEVLEELSRKLQRLRIFEYGRGYVLIGNGNEGKQKRHLRL